MDVHKIQLAVVTDEGFCSMDCPFIDYGHSTCRLFGDFEQQEPVLHGRNVRLGACIAGAELDLAVLKEDQ